jgi:formyl-CoA transferase
VSTSTSNGVRSGVLHGIKVVEFAHIVAGPLAGALMADLGAEVVHVEPPGTGDIARTMGPTKNGESLWWKVGARNKRSVTLDLRTTAGQGLARRLAGWADVVITNMRADTLERWGLHWERLHAENPKLVMLQISGYGSDTSRRNDPGLGKVGEAMSGVVAITGFPDDCPVHTGFSHGDSVTALMGAFAVTAALTRRAEPDFDGERIDLALFESLFRLIEWQVVVYDQLGLIPNRMGNQLFVAPAAVVNTYRTVDDKWVTVTSAGAKSVANVAKLLGEDPAEFDGTALDELRSRRLDEGLRSWIGERSAEDCVKVMSEHGVIASRVFTVEDILADQTYAERGDIVSVADPVLGPVRMQGVVPKMHCRPGSVWRTGPALGEDNEVIYRERLGLPSHEYDELRSLGVI